MLKLCFDKRHNWYCRKKFCRNIGLTAKQFVFFLPLSRKTDLLYFPGKRFSSYSKFYYPAVSNIPNSLQETKGTCCGFCEKQVRNAYTLLRAFKYESKLWSCPEKWMSLNLPQTISLTRRLLLTITCLTFWYGHAVCSSIFFFSCLMWQYGGKSQIS